MIPDYLHYRMCGVLSNEYTNATTTQLLNLRGEWDADFICSRRIERNMDAAAGRGGAQF